MKIMNRIMRTVGVRFAAVAAALAVTTAFTASPAYAASSCADRVVADWSDNGRIDRIYSLECYEAAIDAIPVDLRDYSNAADVIARALTAAAREQPPTGGSGATASPERAPAVGVTDESSVPIPFILAIAISLLVLAGGLIGHLTRRHRGSTSRKPATE